MIRSGTRRISLGFISFAAVYWPVEGQVQTQKTDSSELQCEFVLIKSNVAISLSFIFCLLKNSGFFSTVWFKEKTHSVSLSWAF